MLGGQCLFKLTNWEVTKFIRIRIQYSMVRAGRRHTHLNKRLLISLRQPQLAITDASFSTSVVFSFLKISKSLKVILWRCRSLSKQIHSRHIFLSYLTQMERCWLEALEWWFKSEPIFSRVSSKIRKKKSFLMSLFLDFSYLLWLKI